MGDIALHGMPLPPPCHQLKYDDVQTVDAELFDIKVLLLAVKNRNAAAVSTWHLCCHHPKATILRCVNPLC